MKRIYMGCILMSFLATFAAKLPDAPDPLDNKHVTVVSSETDKKEETTLSRITLFPDGSCQAVYSDGKIVPLARIDLGMKSKPKKK